MIADVGRRRGEKLARQVGDRLALRLPEVLGQPCGYWRTVTLHISPQGEHVRIEWPPELEVVKERAQE